MNNTFKTKTVQFKEAKNILKYSDLISLIKDEKHIEFFESRFNPDSQKKYIQIGNVDIAYKAVKNITDKYEFLNYYAKNSAIETYIIESDDGVKGLKIGDMIFNIKECYDDNGEIHNNIRLKAIYSSLNQFYEDRKLSTHMNYLKGKRDNYKIKAINDLWRDESKSGVRKYKILKSHEGNLYLRALKSTRHYDYGTAFSFVLTILLINESLENDKSSQYTIESLNLNESKISMSVSEGKGREIKGLGYVRSSILLENNDIGTSSLSIKNLITILSNVDNAYPLSIIPSKTGVKRELNAKYLSASHNTNLETMSKKFVNIYDYFYSLEIFEDTYKDIIAAKNPESLRSAIEQKIISSPILKESRDLKDLFKRKQTSEINTMSQLINLCGKAEALNVDYDIKSKLREMISKILLT